MNSKPLSVLLEEAFAHCRDMDASLAERLQDWCLGKLAYFKAPGWMLFVDRLPTTGTQKVQKTEIFPRGEDPRRRSGALDLRARKKRA